MRQLLPDTKWQKGFKSTIGCWQIEGQNKGLFGASIHTQPAVFLSHLASGIIPMLIAQLAKPHFSCTARRLVDECKLHVPRRALRLAPLPPQLRADAGALGGEGPAGAEPAHPSGQLSLLQDG